MQSLECLVSEAKNIVILTGAGISTESGIPDFRSPGGVWESFRIVQFHEFISSEKARLEDWRRRFFMEDQLSQAKPNIGHNVIAKWVKEGKCTKIITQNIDGLHQLAGTPDEDIIEIHGSARHANCLSCDLRYEMDECRKMLEETDQSPLCNSCGGIVKSAVVMFGQQMPKEKTQQAFKEAENCDLFLAIGTSLTVQPANNLPSIAKRAGAKFAIINRDPTELDWKADVVVNGEIGVTLGQITVG